MGPQLALEIVPENVALQVVMQQRAVAVEVDEEVLANAVQVVVDRPPRRHAF